MKPLYLNGAAVNRIRLEHDSLRVITEQRADTWFPLNRISRIVLSGDMQLSSKVLAACLSQNIPIVVAGQKGEFVGVCFGTNFRQQSLQSHILELYESRAQLYILDNWFLGQQRQQILHLQKRFRLPLDVFDADLAANGHLPSGTLRNQLIHYYQSHSCEIERFTRLQIDKLWHRFYEAQHERE